MKKLYGTCLDQDGNLISSQNKKNDRGGRLNEKTAIAHAKGMVAHATITLCAVILGFACTWQHSEFDEGGVLPTVPKQEEVVEELVTLKLVIHDGLNATKAGLDPTTDEKNIEEVDVLVFEHNATDPDEGKYLYMYRAVAADFSTNEDNGNTVVNIKLKIQGTQDAPVHLLVLANSQIAVGNHWGGENDDFFDDVHHYGKTLVQIGDKIGFGLTIKNVSSTSPNVTQYNESQPVPIPMWGHLDNVRVTPEGLLVNGTASLNGINEVKLLRAIAKIELGFGVDNTDIDNPIPLLPNHTLGDIVYYNYPTTGRAIPHFPSNFIGPNDNDSRYIDDPTVIIAKVPSMAGVHSRHADIDSILYSRHADLNALPYPIPTADLSPGGRRDTIYSFEEEGYVGTRNLETCLVVQIFDENQVGRYYRIDFKQDGQKIYILRNHHYKINIIQINSPGYNTSREALEGDGDVWVDLEVGVIGFDDDNVIEWEPDDLDGDV
jgi:hypothetical protein